MLKTRIFALIIVILGALLGYGLVRSFSPSETTRTDIISRHPFKLGLDLSGGTHLLYKADVSSLPNGDVTESMDALRDVIERRINIFGVAEPVVEVETSILGGTKEHRLSIQLPGITDTAKAIEMIGQTPFLEFRTQNPKPPTVNVSNGGNVVLNPDDQFIKSELTGKYLKRAQLVFNPTTGTPEISIQFNDEGSKLFEKITKENVNKVIAIYLDGQPISAPVVREAITGGTAQISGDFTPEEARTLVGRLNSGALPVPISLVSTQIVGATLGGEAINAGVKSAMLGFILIAIFLILWYRLPGVISVLSLGIYVVITLLLYKFIPVTLTAAGIAGFIISIGIAVDANILIFERFKEEVKRGKSLGDAMSTGFDRAWLSIRDSNIAGLITSVILFWFGTSLIKGFALTFGLGVIVSLISALLISKVLLKALPKMEGSKIGRFLYSNGLGFKK
jgi:preprotein translocase subunit SecD